MCIGCHWANYRDFFASSSQRGGSGLTRRHALRRGALFTASAARQFPRARPSSPRRSPPRTRAPTSFSETAPSTPSTASKPWARAVAVKGKRIAFVGDEAGVQSFDRAADTRRRPCRQNAASRLCRGSHPSPRRRRPHARRGPSIQHQGRHPRRAEGVSRQGREGGYRPRLRLAVLRLSGDRPAQGGSRRNLARCSRHPVCHRRA